MNNSAQKTNSSLEISKMEPHQRLRKAVEDLRKHAPKLTLNDIMVLVGYADAASHLSEMMSGKKKITNRFLNAFELRCQVKAHWIKTGEGDEFISKPPQIEPYKSSNGKDASKSSCSDIYVYHRLEKLEEKIDYLIQQRAHEMAARAGQSYESCLLQIYTDLSNL